MSRIIDPADRAVPLPGDLLTTLRHARYVVVLTGAGVSAESGIATFRDADGLWARFNPDEVASPAAFRRDPRRVWEWYAVRREQMAASPPNAAHLALAEIERRVPRFDLITQNIDGLHQRAGNHRVIELHGNIGRVRCWREDVVVAEPADDRVPPRCPRCGDLLRPDVVWFGETLPLDAFTAAVDAARSCDLFLSVGTSALVEPAASLPFEAFRRGAPLIEVNPETTVLTPLCAYALRGPAGTALPRLVDAAWPRRAEGGVE